MKQAGLFIIGCLLLSINATAQVWEETKAMTKGVENALIVEIHEADAKMIEKEWTKQLKGYKAKVKKNRKTGEIFADNASIPNVSGNTLDVYSTVTPSDSKFILSVWFDLGGAYLNSSEHSDGYIVASQLMQDFSLKMQTDAISAELKAQEKIYDKEEATMKKLVAENERLRSDIEMYKQKILEAEEALKTNEANQVQQKNVVAMQKEALEQVKQKLENVGNQ